MSQIPRFTRARQLTSSVLPGRRADDYADQVSARLRKIAAARGTGVLPFSGRSDGAIYFRDGLVAYAEARRTPGPVLAVQPDNLDDLRPLHRIAAILTVTEPTVDATLELLSAQARYAKFRTSRVPDTGPACDVSLEALLAEVARRQRVLSQLSGILTTDTALARNPGIRSESIRVSALQWALLIRVCQGSTPRGLAWDLSRSVFGTTAEVYRLLTRGLVSVAGDLAPALDDAPGDAGGPALARLSFLRAVSIKKGGTVSANHASINHGSVNHGTPHASGQAAGESDD
jgi:hypothetical protein